MAAYAVQQHSNNNNSATVLQQQVPPSYQHNNKECVAAATIKHRADWKSKIYNNNKQQLITIHTSKFIAAAYTDDNNTLLYCVYCLQQRILAEPSLKSTTTLATTAKLRNNKMFAMWRYFLIGKLAQIKLQSPLLLNQLSLKKYLNTYICANEYVCTYLCIYDCCDCILFIYIYTHITCHLIYQLYTFFSTLKYAFLLVIILSICK